ncbi:hypothetical protein BKA69DRAFT_1037554 [Paraphysoderma sedebokerense]|nr:hypothetical protein BKA69DRAFT_1037554 [Paraphysoderma sedebokerense]
MSSLQEWDLLSDPEHPLNNNSNYESSSPDEFPFDNDGFSLNFKENYSSDEERDSYYRNFRGKKSTTVASDSDTADDLPSSFYNRSTSASFRHPGHQSIPQVLPHTSATSSVPTVSVDPSVSLRPPSCNSTKGSRSNSRSNHLALEEGGSKESSEQSNLYDHRRMKKGKERVTERSHKDTLSAAAGGPTSSSMGGDAGLPFPSDNSPAIVDFPRKRPSESSNYSPHSSRGKRRRISAEDCVSESYEFTTSGDTGLGTSSPESSHSNPTEALVDTSNSNNCHQSSYAFQTSSDTANQGTSSRRMHDTWHGNSNLEATSKTCSNGVVVINSSPEARGAIVSSHQALNESGPNSVGSNSPIDDLRQIQMEILTSDSRPTTSVETEFSNIMSSSHNGNDRAGIGTSHQGCEENDSTEVHSPISGCSHTSTDQEILNLSAFNSFSAQESDLPPSSNRTTGIPHRQRESAHPLFGNSSSNTTGNGDRQSAANQLPSREIVNIDSSDNEVDVNSSTRDSRIASNSSASPHNFTVPTERLTRRTRPPLSNDGPIVISSDDDNFRSRVSPRERDPVRFHFTRTRSRNGETAANSRDSTCNAISTSTLHSNSNRTRPHLPSSEDTAVPTQSNDLRNRREAWLSEVLESRIPPSSELPQQESRNNIATSEEAFINRRRDVAPTRHERMQRMLDQMEMRFPEDFVNRMASSSAQGSTFRDTGILNRRRRVNDRGPMIGRRGRMDPWGWPMNIDDTSDVVAVTERTANGSTSAASLSESERERQLREDEELARRLQEEEARAVNPIAAGNFGNMASTSDNRYFGMRAPRAHPAYNDDSRSINIHIPVPPAAGLFPESAFGGNFGRNSRRYNFVSFGGLRSNLGNYMNDDALNSMSYDDLYQLGQTIGSAVNRLCRYNIVQQCHEKDEPKPSTATASSTSRSPIRAISIRDLLAVPGRGVNRRFRGDYGDHTLPRDRSERHPRFNPNVTARTRGRQAGGERRESRNASSSVSNADDDIEIVAVRDSGSTRNAVEVDGPRNTRQTARRGGRRNFGQSALVGSSDGRNEGSGGDEGGDGAISSRLRRGRRRN